MISVLGKGRGDRQVFHAGGIEIAKVLRSEYVWYILVPTEEFTGGSS